MTLQFGSLPLFSYTSSFLIARFHCILLFTFFIWSLLPHFIMAQEVQTQGDSEFVKQAVANVSIESDLDSFFLDSSNIEITDKPVMLVFGKNDCYHCSILSASLIGNSTIQGYILLNFSPYYINLDDKKKHNIPYLSLSRINSMDTARLYNTHALPLIVFISTDSKEIMRVSGFPGEKRIINLLEFINNDVWKNFETPKQRVEGFLEYEKEQK